jgi:hypothetical protein
MASLGARSGIDLPRRIDSEARKRRRVRSEMHPWVLMALVLSVGACSQTELKEFEVVVTDLTESRPPQSVEVSISGGESFFPDLGTGSDTHSFGEIAVGQDGALSFFPDGRDGTEMVVEFTITEFSGSDSVTTNIEIFDTRVEVFGMALPGSEKGFDR